MPPVGHLGVSLSLWRHRSCTNSHNPFLTVLCSEVGLCMLSCFSHVLTLCNTMGCSPPGSSLHGILQARTLGVGCHFLLQEILPTQESKPRLMSAVLAVRFFTHSATWGSAEKKFQNSKEITPGAFPGGLILRISPSTAGSAGSIPGWGSKILYASPLKLQKLKQEQYCNRFNKDFKNDPH